MSLSRRRGFRTPLPTELPRRPDHVRCCELCGREPVTDSRSTFYVTADATWGAIWICWACQRLNVCAMRTDGHGGRTLIEDPRELLARCRMDVEDPVWLLAARFTIDAVRRYEEAFGNTALRYTPLIGDPIRPCR